MSYAYSLKLFHITLQNIKKVKLRSDSAEHISITFARRKSDKISYWNQNGKKQNQNYIFSKLIFKIEGLAKASPVTSRDLGKVQHQLLDNFGQEKGFWNFYMESIRN